MVSHFEHTLYSRCLRLPHYVQTLRQLQNRNDITYCVTATAEPSHDVPQATCKEYLAKFGHVVSRYASGRKNVS